MKNINVFDIIARIYANFEKLTGGKKEFPKIETKYGKDYMGNRAIVVNVTYPDMESDLTLSKSERYSEINSHIYAKGEDGEWDCIASTCGCCPFSNPEIKKHPVNALARVITGIPDEGSWMPKDYITECYEKDEGIFADLEDTEFVI